MHSFASGIANRVPTSHFFEGLRPPWRDGTGLAFVADGSEDPIKHLIYSSWSEQPKVSNRMLVTL